MIFIKSPKYCARVNIILATNDIVGYWHFSSAFPIPRINEDIVLVEEDRKSTYRVQNVVYELQDNKINVYVVRLY